MKIVQGNPPIVPMGQGHDDNLRATHRMSLRDMCKSMNGKAIL